MRTKKIEPATGRGRLPPKRPPAASVSRRRKTRVVAFNLSRASPPGFTEPCLPTNARAVPSGPQWVYEIKHGGFRFICRRDGERVRVFPATAVIGLIGCR